MDDASAPPRGTIGTVTGVDDIGSLIVQWENGSGLHVIYGEDTVEIVTNNLKKAEDEKLSYQIGTIHNMVGCLLLESAETAQLIQQLLDDQGRDGLSKKERSYLLQCLTDTLPYLKRMQEVLQAQGRKS
jgi:hypothetical protein